MRCKLWAWLLAVLLPQSLFAGAVIKVMNQHGIYLLPRKVVLSVQIENQVAITTVKQTFVNTTGDSARMKYGFPAGPRTAVTGFRWWMHGRAYRAEVVGRPMDTTAVEPGGIPDNRFLDYCGGTPFFFSFKEPLAPDSLLVVEMTYMELLAYRDGRLNYRYPLNFYPLPFGQLDSLIIRGEIHSARTLKTFEPQNSWLTEGSLSDSLISFQAVLPSFIPNEDVAFRYSVSQKELGVFLFSTIPSGDSGYFLLLAEPNPETSQQEVIDKYFTLIIDRSGSMQGSKIQQAQEAARYILNHLNTEDHFNLISFANGVAPFRNQPVPVTTENIAAALRFVDGLDASGGTNIYDALLAALAQPMPDSTANIIIFLTDGQPTVKITNAGDILKAVRQHNIRGVRLFVFGIGTDVNRYLLTSLADQNHGIAEYLLQDEVETRISAFYKKIRNPLLKDVRVSFEGGGVYEIYPLHIPDIYVGEQLVLTGRYRTPGPAEVVLSAQGVQDSLTCRYNVILSADSTRFPFVPKIWAMKKIEDLLALIDIYGESSNQGQEYKSEIIRLSIQYGIITRYTSFEQAAGGTGSGPGAATEVAEQDDKPALPAQFELLPAFPNPLRLSGLSGGAEIAFVVRGNRLLYHVILRIYDLRGRLVAEVAAGNYGPGRHSVHWNGLDQFGRPVSTGVYLYTLSVGGQRLSRKLVVIR